MFGNAKLFVTMCRLDNLNVNAGGCRVGSYAVAVIKG